MIIKSERIRKIIIFLLGMITGIGLYLGIIIVSYLI